MKSKQRGYDELMVNADLGEARSQVRVAIRGMQQVLDAYKLCVEHSSAASWLELQRSVLALDSTIDYCKGYNV